MQTYTLKYICGYSCEQNILLWTLKHENKHFMYKLAIPCIKLCLLTNK